MEIAPRLILFLFIWVQVYLIIKVSQFLLNVVRYMSIPKFYLMTRLRIGFTTYFYGGFRVPHYERTSTFKNLLKFDLYNKP